MSNNNYEFQEISNDIEGFWVGEGEIILRPKHVHLCDNGAEKRRASVLIVGELVAPCDYLAADQESVALEPGQTVGVWYSPGMRPVLQCAGVVTRIQRDEGKDKKLEGRPSPMKGYSVATPKGARGKALEVLEDYRKQSKGSPTPFDEPARRAEMQADVDDGDVPFA